MTIEVDASNVHRDLVHDGYDFGIRVGPNVDADFVARRLWSGAFGLFASKAFVGRIGRIGRTGQGRARSSSPAITRQVLETGPCLGARVGATWRFRDAKNRVTEVKPSIRFAVNDPRAVISAAARGLGIALAPVDAATGDVVALRTDFGDPEPLDLYLVYPARRLQPRRVREAIQWLIDRG